MRNAGIGALVACFALFSVDTLAQVTPSPASVNFGYVVIGQASATPSVVLKNTGSPVSISDITVTPSVYSITAASTCSVGGALATNGTCKIVLAATNASTVGPLTAGTLAVTTTAPAPVLSVPLNGTGVQPMMASATSIPFGNVIVQRASPVKSVSIYNRQATGTLNISSIAFPSGYTLHPSTTCKNPGPLAAGLSCVIAITLTPASIGPIAAGSLVVSSDAANTPINIALSGTGIAATKLSPLTVAFGKVAVGATSTLQLAISNNSAQALTFSGASFNGPFSIDIAATPANECPLSGGALSGSLAGAATCVLPLKFAPLSTGSVSGGSITISSDDPAGSATAALTGMGMVPTQIAPSSISFGNVVQNTTSPIRSLTFTNNLAASLSFTSISVPPPYAFVNVGATPCAVGTPVAAGGSCTISITLTPTALGSVVASNLTVIDDAGVGPKILTIPLSGAGIAATTLVPSQVAFGSVAVNSSSATKILTLTNNLSTPANLGGSVPNGPFALDTTSAISGACPILAGQISGPLPAGGSCAIGLIFQPTALGSTLNGKFTVFDSSDPAGFVSASLTGTGIVPTGLSPATVAFGYVVQNTTSASKVATFSNNLSSALPISSISVSSPYAVSSGPNACSVGTSVAPKSSCSIYLTFSPTALGAAPANTLSVGYDAGSGTQSSTINLTGTGVPPVVLSPSPTLGFGTVVLGVPTTKTLKLTNYQTTALSISSITGLTGAFSLNAAGTTCPYPSGSVAAAPANNSCLIAVDLKATSTGTQSGTLTVVDDAPGAPQSVGMTGTTVPQVVLSPTSLSFPAQFVGTTSASKTVNLANQLPDSLALTSLSITGTNANDFSLATNCPVPPATLPGNASCTLQVTFIPLASGTRKATLTESDVTTGATRTVALSGAGSAPVLVSPSSITSFSARVGTLSAASTVKITNAQTSENLHISNLALSGDFVQTSTTCGSSYPYTLAPGGSCSLTISFNPSIGGTRPGQLQVKDDVPTSPQVVNLSGNGTSPLTISPGSLNFNAQTVNTPSAAKLITLTNNEAQSETFSLAASGDFSANTNCTNGVIAANSKCNLFVTFTPASTNPSTRTGTLAITHSAANGSPINASLTGSATATPPQPAVAVVSPGAGSANTQVNVTITGNGWTHFSPSSVITFVDTNSAAYPADITVKSFVAVSPNEIDATLVLGDPATDSVFGARNITVRTPLPGGKTESASLLSAFIIADPSQSHQIVNATPPFGSQGQQQMTVALTAQGTHFVQGTTFANFGDGITVNALAIQDSVTAIATISISNTTPVGYRTITLVTGGEFAVSIPRPDNYPIFYVGPNGASLTVVDPNTALQGWSGAITLTGVGTHFLQDATQVSIPGVTVGAVNVSSPTVAVAQVIVPASAPVGTASVTVSTGGEIAGLPNAFTITGSTPGLVSVVPSSAQQGQSTTVVITGNEHTDFSACYGGSITANFNGSIPSGTVTVDPVNPHQVSVPISVSENAQVGGITANLICGTAGHATLFPFGFMVTASSAQITSVVPNNVPQGGQLQLNVTGLNTHWVQGTTTAKFYPVPVPAPSFPEITINSPTSAVLNISIPTNTPVGTYSFYMATGGEVVTSSVHVYANTPTLTMNPANGLTPSGGVPNSFTVNFTGQFTHFDQNKTVPVISGAGVVLTDFTVPTGGVSATATLTILPGAPTGLRLVTFTTGGEIVTTHFNVTRTPVRIVSVDPWHGPQSTNLSSIYIVGLNTHWTSGTTEVLFGPQITVNGFIVVDETHITADITTNYMNGAVLTPTPPGYQNVYVNTGDEQVIGGFVVDAPATPAIISVTPNSAQQGSTATQVTITGSLTNWVQGQSELILGAGVTVANLQIISPTTATAIISVAPTAPVGPNGVIMITGSEIDSGTGFSVTPSVALIQSVEPNFTCPVEPPPGVANICTTPGAPPTGVPVVTQLQTVTLNIVGIGTHWLQGETTISFGPGVNIDALSVLDPTHAVAQITVLSTSPVGYAALTTYTDGETVTLQQAIDIESGFPKLLAISPGAGQQGATFTMQILGRYTHWQQGVTQVTFNSPDLSVVPNSINVIDSQNMTVGVTVSPMAYVDYSPACGHVILVTTGSEQVSSNPVYQNFCVQQGAEQITGVLPLSGIQGSTLVLTITGSATNFTAGVTQVSFDDSGFQVGQITVNSPTCLSVPVALSTSTSTGFKNVTVTTLGQVATQQFSFTISPGVATLNEAIPNQAEQGAPLSSDPPLVVRLLGQYSHFSGSTTATFGPGITVQSVQYVSATEVDATIAIDPLSYVGGRNVTVTTPDVSCSHQPPVGANFTNVTYQGCVPGDPSGTGKEIVSANIFTIIPGPAIITDVSPATGNEGQEVAFNLTGLDTHWQQNFTQFYIAGGGSDIKVNSVVINSATSATIDISISETANPGPRSVFMVTNGESLTDRGAFVVTGGIPVVTSVSPNNALKGTQGVGVTINGNAYTQWNAATKISFGPGITVSSYQIEDKWHIGAVLNIDDNAQVGYRTVIVQTGTQVLTGYFQVKAPEPPPSPYIWYENPSSAIPGQTLTITFNGAFTHWDPDPITGTQLTGFDSNVAINSFQVTSPTSALANITVSPTATQAYYTLSLTTNTVSPAEVDFAGFSVVVAQPTLSVVDPGSAMQGAQNVVVNIIGQFTHFDNTTSFTFGPGITNNGPPTILGPTVATQSISIGIETPTGGYPVVSTTTDAPAGQGVVGGAGFSVTPSLAHIDAVTPNTALQGSTIQVEVVGSNTHWAGNTTFNFGAGIAVISAHVNSPSDATLTLAIPAFASTGPTWVNAVTSGEVASITNGFVVQAGTPMLLSSGPGSLAQQSSAIFTILSQATNWSSANPPAISYGPGVVLTNVNVTSPTSMTVNGYVQPTTNVGYRNLTVSTGNQTLNLYNVFYVTPGPAVINSVTAKSAGQGATLTVTVKGTNTSWQQGITSLSFPGASINNLTVTSANTIVANITISNYAPAGQVTLTATTAGETATGVNVFTVTQTQPELLAVVSSSGMQGQTETVTITGAFTHFSSADSVPAFGAGITVNSVNAVSPGSLQVNITVQPTATLGARNVSVTTGTEVVNLNNAFNVTVGPAAILGLDPINGGQGNSYTVNITGSQTHFQSGVTTAAVGGGIAVTGITVTDLSHASINIQVPSSSPLGAYDVSLYTGGETARILGGFTVTGGTPQISQVSPPTGPQGATHLSVQLTGLYTHFVSGSSAASFGSGITVNSLSVQSATVALADITISATATQGNRNVSVTTGSEMASITGGFTVLPGVPALTQVVPSTADAGSNGNTVIFGVFTSFQQGFSSVSMGNGINVDHVYVTNTTQLTVHFSVASNASVGPRDVSVTTNGQTLTLNNAFTVLPGTPVITQISPNIGNPGQSIPVTITGQYTNWINGTTVAGFGGGINVISTVVNSVNNLTANITIPSDAPVGPVDVTVTTFGEVEPVAGGFTIQAASIPAPYLISISPSPNAGGIPVNSSFTAVFSQPMDRTTINSGTVIFYLCSNPGGWIQVPITINVDASGRVSTFNTSGLLAANAQYYLRLTGGIRDATGNAFGDWAQYFYTIFNANTSPVTVAATNPPANSVGIGTNVPIQVAFSADMNQSTQTGMIVMAGGNPISGSYSWNGSPYCCWGPSTVLTFTPTAPLQPNTVYTVSYNNSLTDTADNAVTPGSFSFTTGAGADIAQNYTGPDFNNYISDVGINFAPKVKFSKPVNRIGINTGTLLLYNADSGKYVPGAVTVAPSGMNATFKPLYSLLPYTLYRIHQASGYYDVAGNYLNGVDAYFTTGATSDVDTPTVGAVSPANGATGVPLNSQIVIHFAEPVDPDTIDNNTISVIPTAGGSVVAGTVSLAGDLVTLTFTPATTSANFAAGLQPGTNYTVQVSGFYDLEGNTGATFTSTFTTADSLPVINVSTGVSATGALITTSGTPDPHWSYVSVSGTPSESTFSAPGTPQPLQVVAPGAPAWYSGWAGNGPNSSWVTIDANNVGNNTHGVYATTFTLPNPLPSYHLCLTGRMGIDDRGLLGVNGTAIMTEMGYTGNAPAPISIDISGYVVPGTNTLSLGWGWTDNSYEAFRLEAVVEKCGASMVNSLTLTSATPGWAATNVPVDTNITLTFSNPLDPATVNSSTLPVMVGWNSNQEIAGTYAVNGNQVVFTPASPFPINTQIWIGACNGPMDMAGDSAGSCYTQLDYFTTGGTVVPATSPFQVIAFTPANNATNIGLRAPVAATFNRSVNLSSVNASDFGLFAGGSQYPWCTSMVHSQDDATIAFNCYALPSSTLMTAMLGSGISDWQGNTIPNFRSQFTTSYWDSNTNGSVTGSRPGNGGGGVDPNAPLTLFFNLPIDPGTAQNGLQVAENNNAIPGSVQVLDNGYVLVFTPSAPFAPGALIQWWTTGTLIESAYNTTVNGASGYFYVASNPATLTPSVQVISPWNGNQSIPLNTIFDVQFNTALNPNTVNESNIYLYDSHTGLHVPASYSTPQPNEVRIVPSTPLSASSWIYLYLTTGLQSATSVPAASHSWSFYTTGAVDSSMPLIVSAVPYNSSTNIGINVAPGVVFNKIIDSVSVTNSTFQVSHGGNPIPGNFWLNSNNTRLQFIPNQALPASSTITLTLNGVLDMVGNPINYTSTFQTSGGPDYTSPNVVSTSISPNGSVPVNSAFTVQFSESMDVTTFSMGSAGNCGNIRIRDTLQGWYCIGASLSWSADQAVAYIVPDSPLAAGRQYYLEVTGGTDLAGNGLNSYGNYFYGQLGSATSAPAVTYFNPLPNATGLGTNAIIEAQFSAPIDPTTLANVTLTTGGAAVTASASVASGNTVLQLVPSAPLQANTTYVMTVAGVKDPAGNHVATVTNTFTTGSTYDIGSPSVVNYAPAYNNTVGTNVTPKFVFNEPLNPITVNNNTFRMYLNDTNQWIPLAVTPSADGLTVTMVPQVAIQPSTRYYFQACCSFQDQNGNNGNGSTVYFWTSGGAVTSGPTVAVTPADGTAGVPLNTQVIANISAPVDPTSVGKNAIQLFDSQSNPVPGTVNLVSVQQINFAPGAPLAPGATYSVKVDHFRDSNGNAVVPYAGTFTTGTTPITTGFSLTGAEPGWGAGNVIQTQIVTLTFSQNIVPATLSTLMVMNGWNTNYPLAGTWAMTAPNQAQFTPSSPYPPGAQVWIGSCGGPTDVLGEVYNNGSCWTQLDYFTVNSATPDTTPLQVLSVSPPPGATNIKPDTTVSVTFNKGINPYSAYSTSNALLFAGQGLQNRGSVSVSADSRTLYFNTGTLYSNATYTVYLPAGGISDNVGNTLAATYSSTFTTGSNPVNGNGSVVGTAPGGNASGVPAGSLLTLYVNHQVDSATLPGNLTVTVNGQIYPGTVLVIADGYEVQYTPTTPFPAGATVQWFFSNVYDIYGNAINSTSNVFYTTPAVDPAIAQPTIVSISPACCNSPSVPTNAVIDIQYSLPIDGTTLPGNIYMYSWGNGQYLYDTAGAFTLMQPTPNVVRITMASPLTPSTQYGVCTNGSVKGTNGVNAPAASCWATYFTTTSGPDNTPGTIKVGPPNNVINVGTNAYIRFQFSKPADRATMNSANIQITAGGDPIPGYWSYNYSGADLWGANFSPLNPLPASSVISITASNILDYAGNAFPSVDSQFTTAPLPDYSTPSVSMDFAWWQGGIGTNASFTCRYSEPMDPSSVTDGNTYLYGWVENRHIPVTYQWSADLMSVTMTPVNSLFANSQYGYWCTGAIDLTGNGQSNDTRYFYTGGGPSSTGPMLIQTNPPNGMTNVPLNNQGGPWGTALMLQFDKAVSASSLGAVTLTPAGGSPMPISTATAWNSPASTIAVVSLPWALAPNTTYSYNVAGVMGMDGNPVLPATSTFTTGSSFDWSQPWVASTSPSNGATDVGISGAPISVTFNKPMNPVLIDTSHIFLRTHNTQATIPATLAMSPDYATATLTPAAALDQNTIYDLVVNNPNWCMTDVAANNLNNCSWYVVSTFTTGTAAAVDGICGPANGGAYSSAPPAASLCTAGTASVLTNPGSWTWSCKGQYGGQSASCSAAFGGAGAPACVPQQPGLVSWWPGNDHPNDLIGGNNGTPENGIGYALGETADAFSMNGNNQFVLIGQPVPANLQIQNAITLSAWIYVTQYPADYGSGSLGMIVGSQHDGTAGGASIFYDGRANPDGLTGVPPGHIHFQIGDGNWHATNSLTQVPLNQWVLITATRSANGPGRIYYNGVLQPSAMAYNTTWSGNISYNGSWFAIGQQSDLNRPFNGLIDEVQTYNTELSATQVQALYNSGTAGMCAAQTASTTNLNSSDNPTQVGVPVTFTADVLPSTAKGTVTFLDGPNALASPINVNSGEAQLTTSGLTFGAHRVRAFYSGDTNFTAAFSPVLTQVENLDGAKCAPQPAGLIDWYRAESNAGDSIGGNPGTIEGAVSYVPGLVGQAFSFSSSGNVSLPISSINTAWGSQVTVSFWMNWSGNDAEMPFGFTSYDLYLYGGHFGFNTANGDIWGINSNGLANTWNQVTAVFTNGDPRANKIYINGAEQSLSQQMGSTKSSVQVATQAKIGGWNNDGNYRFNGVIDELQIFNRALTAAEIQSIYETGAAGVCTAQTPTTTSLASSQNPLQTGTPVTFTAKVSPSAATGTITFLDGSTALGNPVALSGGQATWTTSSLALGAHNITAIYGGDATYSGSASQTVAQSVSQNAWDVESFADDFEAPQFNSFWQVTFGGTTNLAALSSYEAHSGGQSAAEPIPASTVSLVSDAEVYHSFTSSLGVNGTISVWFYDSMYLVGQPGSGTNLWTGLSFVFPQGGGGIAISPAGDLATTNFYSAIFCLNQPTHTCNGPGGDWSFGTSVSRSLGWHHFQVASTPQNLTYFIDGVQVLQIAGSFGFTSLDLTTSISTPRSADFAFYFDDFSWTP
jgi:hypothetical protein